MKKIPKIIQGGSPLFVNPDFGIYTAEGSNGTFRKGNVHEIVHDGDTLTVSLNGNMSVRFLGIDTPEISFNLHNNQRFFATDSQEWIDYLNGLRALWPSMEETLGSGLFTYISNILDKGNVALNHNIHAKRAEAKLESLIIDDMNFLGLNKENMKFFLPFAYEVLDGFGRFLGFVHPDLKNPAITLTNLPKRIPSYNTRLLETGFSLPYFIWPNINPFRKEDSVVAAAYRSVDELRDKLNSDESFNSARKKVKEARATKVGVFEPDINNNNHTCAPLFLEAFELRYLARKAAPDRYFIDINASDNIIIPPTEYYKYLSEDRLFIPEAYVPLLEKRGWKVE